MRDADRRVEARLGEQVDEIAAGLDGVDLGEIGLERRVPSCSTAASSIQLA